MSRFRREPTNKSRQAPAGSPPAAAATPPIMLRKAESEKRIDKDNEEARKARELRIRMDK